MRRIATINDSNVPDDSQKRRFRSLIIATVTVDHEEGLINVQTDSRGLAQIRSTSSGCVAKKRNCTGIAGTPGPPLRQERGLGDCGNETKCESKRKNRISEPASRRSEKLGAGQFQTGGQVKSTKRDRFLRLTSRLIVDRENFWRCVVAVVVYRTSTGRS